MIFNFQHDISTYFENDKDKFDIVYDACTNSGAGEDYKDKVICVGLLVSSVQILEIILPEYRFTEDGWSVRGH